MYTVYVLYSSKMDKYYIGSTQNIEDRLKRHNAGRSKYTKPGMPWQLMYTASYPTRSEAYQQERALKALKNRTKLEALIHNKNISS